MGTPRSARLYYGWILLGWLGLISIVANGTLQYIFSVLVVPVGQDLGWSRSELSLGYPLALLVASLPGRYVFNALSDRIAPQRLLALSQGILAAGVLLLVLARSRGWLIGYLVVYGSAFGATGGLIASARAAHFGRKAVGPVLAGLLYDRSGSYTLTFAAVCGGCAGDAGDAPAGRLPGGLYLINGISSEEARRPTTGGRYSASASRLPQ